MRLRLAAILILSLPLAQAGCAILEQTLALRQVQFAFDGVNNANLAGVNINNLSGYDDLGILEIGRIGAAVASGNLPLNFTAVIGAENPADNQADARVTKLDWILLLDDTETINGIFNDDRLIPRGQRSQIPISMELDLIRFFGNNIPDLVNLASAVSGHGESELALRLRPTVNTALGPISYPGYLTLRYTVGG